MAKLMRLGPRHQAAIVCVRTSYEKDGLLSLPKFKLFSSAEQRHRAATWRRLCIRGRAGSAKGPCPQLLVCLVLSR